MQEDRRMTLRVSFVRPVEYGQRDEVAGGSIAGNISLSGISLKVQKFIPIGAYLQLQIRMDPPARVIWIKGQVVRVREILSEGCYEIGLKFVKDEVSIKAIGAYIKRRIREGG